MKRIAFFVPSLAMGGMERVLVTYANLFSRRDYDVTVFNLTSGDAAITDNFDSNVHYYEKYIPVSHILHAKFSDIIRFCFRIRPFSNWIKYHSARCLAKKYIVNDFDVVIAFFGATSMKIVSGIANRSTIKIGWFHSENIEDDISLFGGKKRAQEILRQFSSIICVSKKIKTKLQNVFGNQEEFIKNLFVVNNPNDSKRIRLMALESVDESLKDDVFSFINVSRLDDKSKGFLRLFNVCKKLNDEGYTYKLYIVGEGNDKELIVNRAKELNLRNIIFLGKQKNPYKYINHANMYLCSSYYEGFSMSLIETIILGKPILSTKVSGVSEMLDNGKYGMIVDNSEEGLYEGMKKILSDKAFYDHFCDMAQYRKDYLTEDNIMDGVENILFGK